MAILLRGLGPSRRRLVAILLLTNSIWFLLLRHCAAVASSTTNLLISTSSVSDFPLNTLRASAAEARAGRAFSTGGADAARGLGLGKLPLRLGGGAPKRASLWVEMGAHRQARVNVVAARREDDFFSFPLVGLAGRPLGFVADLHRLAASIARWYHGFLHHEQLHYHL